MNPKPLRHIDLFSSAGRLEALYRELQDPAGIAVVCHPLPSGGGTLHNKVVFRAARGLEAANVATLRFNFRGVGASAGHFDEGEGEQADVQAAMDWARRKHPGKPLFVGGFSFGAWVASLISGSQRSPRIVRVPCQVKRCPGKGPTARSPKSAASSAVKRYGSSGRKMRSASIDSGSAAG